MRTSLPLAFFLAGCVGTADPAGAFLLAVDDAPIDIEAPGSILVQLVVIGADGEDVTIEAPDLPSFGTLDGAHLTFEPGFEDAGDYAFELVARSGTQVDGATMRLHVTRVNTAPYWVPSMMISGGAEPLFSVVVVDDEGDAMTVEVEAVPAGTPSSMTATHSTTAEPDLLYYATEEHPYAAGAEVEVPLTGLSPGDYDYRVRVLDELGAEGPYAWYHFGTFTQD